MSYILDALRRAEAQREQQTATPPGLGHPAVAAQPAAPAVSASPEGAPPPGAAADRRGWLGGLAVGGGLALVIFVGLQSMRPAAPPAAQKPAVSTPATPDTAPTRTAPPVPPAATSALPPAPILQPAPEAPTAPDRPAPVDPPARSAAKSSDAVPRYADLPESVRSGLPAISVQGVTWSENPAWRHLIVNGRVLQEGQSIGPDHVLEQIGRDSSVLNHRGQRYRVGH